MVVAAAAADGPGGAWLGASSGSSSCAPAVALAACAPPAWAVASGKQSAAVACRAERSLLEAAAAGEARRAWGRGSRSAVRVPPSAAEVCGWAEVPLPSFHAARDVYPQLAVLQTRVNFAAIQREAQKVAETGWKDWPEEHYSDGGLQDWKVFPFVHTFPANDPSATTFIASTCAACPHTAGLLKV
jgi:hypothetical protein